MVCNGDKKEALQVTRRALGIGYGDAKILISEGRRLQRLQRKA